MCWNISEGDNDGHYGPRNSALPVIAEHIRSKSPDVVLLNEVLNGSVLGVLFRGLTDQVRRLAESTKLPHYQSLRTSATGVTGWKVVAVLAKYPLTPRRAHPVTLGPISTGYATLETSFVADERLHHVFSTRFDGDLAPSRVAANVAGHEQAAALVRRLEPTTAVLFGGDFNVDIAAPQFKEFVRASGLTNTYDERPDPQPCRDVGHHLDHILYRGPYSVTQMELRCPWDGAEVSNHPWVFAELSRRGGYVQYGSRIGLEHVATGKLLRSEPLNYVHPRSSGQQMVVAFSRVDLNAFWRVEGPNGEAMGSRNGKPVRHDDRIRLRHFTTRRNLHSHNGYPSPLSDQQEITCFGQEGVGDGNDDWRVEVEGGGIWDVSKKVRLIHVATQCALHSHAAMSHWVWTRGQQEVTGFPGRDGNDWWRLW